MKQSDAALYTQRRCKRQFSDLHWSLLVFMGGLSFLVAAYWGLALSKLVPNLIETTNKFGLPPLALKLWLIIAIYAAGTWFFGCIASRCHSILYERWFT